MRCEKCGCTLFSCQCPNGPTNPLLEIPDNCLPFNGDEKRLLDLLRGPQVGADGKIVGGTYDGMTPDEVLRDRDDYNRICGE